MHRIHARTQAHTHTCTHTHTHKVVVAGGTHNLQWKFLFANNLEVFPYRTSQRHRFTWACLTIRLRHVEHHVRADYINTRMFVYVLWHSNSTVTIKYSNIVLFVSALIVQWRFNSNATKPTNQPTPTNEASARVDQNLNVLQAKNSSILEFLMNDWIDLLPSAVNPQHHH